MTRHEKQYLRLDSLDNELRLLTIRALRNVEDRRETLFFIADYNNPFPEIRPSAQSNDIVNRAREIMAFAEAMSENTITLAASIILQFFDKANDVSNPNRLGPVRLASSLRENLESMSTNGDNQRKF